MKRGRTKTKSPFTDRELARLRPAERILIAAHEAAMREFAIAKFASSPMGEFLASQKAILAMRRTGRISDNAGNTEDIAKAFLTATRVDIRFQKRFALLYQPTGAVEPAIKP